MSDLTTFLLARIAEGEREANACLDQWRRGDGGSRRRWDRMLAECEAKRRIVAMYTDASRESGWMADARLITVFPVLQALALPYADHPDYDEAWRP